MLRPERTSSRAGLLDWVFEKVASGRDEWPVEKLNDKLNDRLKELSERISTLDLGEDSLGPLLASGFRSHTRASEQLDTILSESHLEVERSEVPESEPTHPMTPLELSRELKRSLGGASRMEKAKFKVFRIQRRESMPPSVSTRVLLEADGLLASGELLQIRSVWDCVWIQESSSWRLGELLPIRFERSRLKARPFVEVSQDALGGNASYFLQLQVGLDQWRRRLDSASGMDVYGHQGVSVGDFDGDGWEDLYIAQPAGLPNRLYRNQRDGTFVDSTEWSGLGVLDTTGGSLFLDADNDGDLDLVVVTSQEILIFENNGKGRFERRQNTGLEVRHREGGASIACAAADYDSDNDLDLYCVSYVFWAGAGARPHSSYPYPYHDANNGAPNMLLRNEGNFKFSDVTGASRLDVNNRRFSLAASWADYDADGDPDIYVANDFGKNNLYQNQGDGTFRDVATEAGVEDIGNGMSVTWEDYDGDGRIDLYVGNMWSAAGNRLAEQSGFGGSASVDLRATYRRMARGNSLFRNLGNGRFEDQSLESNTYFGRWSWSSQFIDYDSDGREDLYVSNGFVTNEGVEDL